RRPVRRGGGLVLVRRAPARASSQYPGRQRGARLSPPSASEGPRLSTPSASEGLVSVPRAPARGLGLSTPSASEGARVSTPSPSEGLVLVPRAPARGMLWSTKAVAYPVRIQHRRSPPPDPSQSRAFFYCRDMPRAFGRQTSFHFPASCGWRGL